MNPDIDPATVYSRIAGYCAAANIKRAIVVLDSTTVTIHRSISRNRAVDDVQCPTRQVLNSGPQDSRIAGYVTVNDTNRT